MTAQEEARLKVESWKKEKSDKDESTAKAVEIEMQALQNNPELAKFMNEYSKMGSENIQSSMPTLKLHVANKSVNNIMADGSEPNDGWFFYTKTKQQFQNPIIHILSISRRFHTKGFNDEATGESGKPAMNQILSGVIVENGEYLPFIMYFAGSKLSNMWEFCKVIQPLTHRKPISIPMFALSVKLSSQKQKVEYEKGGKTQTAMTMVVGFELVKGDNEFPAISTDMGELVFLRDLLVQTEGAVNSLIDSKDIGDGSTKSITTSTSGSGYDSAGRPITDIVGDEPVQIDAGTEDIVIPE